MHDLHVYLFLVLFHLFLLNFYAFRKLKDMEKVAWESGMSRMVQGESAEKLTCTAVRILHTAMCLADEGIQILISLLTSQGQARDFTRH